MNLIFFLWVSVYISRLWITRNNDYARVFARHPESLQAWRLVVVRHHAAAAVYPLGLVAWLLLVIVLRIKDRMHTS